MAAETSSLSLYIRELLSSICWIFHSAKAIFLSVDIAALIEKIEGFLHEMICDFSGFHHRPSFDTLNHSIFVESEKCGGWEGRPESWKKGFSIRYECGWPSNSHRASFQRPFTVHSKLDIQHSGTESTVVACREIDTLQSEKSAKITKILSNVLLWMANVMITMMSRSMADGNEERFN